MQAFETASGLRIADPFDVKWSEACGRAVRSIVAGERRLDQLRNEVGWTKQRLERLAKELGDAIEGNPLAEEA